MLRRGSEWVVSASDAVAVLECDHRFALDHAAAAGLVEPVETVGQATGEMVRQRRVEHRADVTAQLRTRLAGGLVEVAPTGTGWAEVERAAEQTEAAMTCGVPAVRGGVLLVDGVLTRPDVLTRVHPLTGHDLLGPHGRPRYEPLDVLLAHSVKDAAMVRLGVHAAALVRSGHPAPDQVHAWLGTGEVVSIDAPTSAEPTAAALEEAQRRAARPPTVPTLAWADKRRACRTCRWEPRCAAGREQARDLALVAGIRYRHVPLLRSAGLTTIDLFAVAGDDERPEEMDEEVFTELRSQAAVQVLGERSGRLELAVWSPRGLDSLPEPDPGDLYYDIEGSPFHDPDGSLEYLHGFVDADERYLDIWAHDRLEERTALERTLDLVAERRRRSPRAHVYHFAAYEPQRLVELAARHGTRQDQVDELVGSGVLVDLLTVVRGSIQVSGGSRSLKKLEPLYMGADLRSGQVQDAEASILEYLRYTELVARGERLEADRVLRTIRDYNRDDCVSTHRLHRWLLALASRTAQVAVAP